jgi:hypothetical protein
LRLRVNADWLEVTFQRRVISSHRIDPTPGISTLREHLAPNHHQFQGSQPPALLEWAEAIDPATQLTSTYNAIWMNDETLRQGLGL